LYPLCSTFRAELCRLWQLDLGTSDLISIAAELGSDIPFFLVGGTALGSGRGEKVEPLPDFPSRHLIVIFPGIQVATAQAYNSLNLGLTSTTEDNRILSFCGQMKEDVHSLTGFFNDFEASILPAYPPVQEAVDFLKREGAASALLSGSGSAVFGFFPSEESALAVLRADARETWQLFPAKTLSRTEYFHRMFG